jgi:hypothetical protein
MKKIALLLSAFSLLSITSKAQDFLGLSTGNYAGISGVHIQPASIADSRYKFDINLTSFSLGFKSNFVGFDRSYAVNKRFNIGGFNSYYDFRTKALTKVALPAGEKGYFDITNTIQIPVSFMLTTSKKSAIALNMRSRTSFAAQNIPGALTDMLFTVNPVTGLPPSSFTADGFNVRGVSWLDIGLTYARTLVDENKHFVKFGITPKYIGGLSSMYLIHDKLDVNVYKADSINFDSKGSTVQYGHSPTNFSVRPENYRPDASSFGFDAGIVYEFRGRIGNFKVGKVADDGEIVTKVRRDKNKYTLRLGASLLDFGTMSFNSSDKARDFTVNKTLNLLNTGISNVSTFDNYVNSQINSYTSNAASAYTIALPTSYNVQADLHIIKGLYVNGMMQRALTTFNSNATFRTYTPEFFAVTPRFETRVLGLYVPFVQNDQKQWRIGTSLRLGPVFVGTGNLATLFKSTSVNEADIHAGLKLPLGFGRPSKAFQKLNKLRSQVNGNETPTDATLPILAPLADEDRTIVVPNAETEEELRKAKQTITDKQALIDDAETKLRDAQSKISELEIKYDAAREAAKQAGLKLAEEPKVEKKEEKKEEKKAEPASKVSGHEGHKGGEPVQIIINNYNTPGAGNGTQQEVEIQGGTIEQQIEMLRKKIEAKEKMLKTLKEAEGSQGCLEVKKKFQSIS